MDGEPLTVVLDPNLNLSPDQQVRWEDMQIHRDQCCKVVTRASYHNV